MPKVTPKKKAKTSPSRKAPKKKAAAPRKKAAAPKKKAAAPKKKAVAPKKKAVAPKKKAAAPEKKAVAPKKKAAAPQKKAVAKKKVVAIDPLLMEQERPIIPSKPAFPKPFLERQRRNLISLREELVNTMAGVARGSVGEHADGAEASAFGMHQADAGSDAYDRDLALNLLSQENNALHEIEDALERIRIGSYGYCEVSGHIIMKERLEAIPFARLTVECQSQIEKQNRLRGRTAPGPIFKHSQL